MNKPIYGWHFVGKTLRDGSPIPPDGEWLKYKGICKLCESGLHFSDTPAMALEYAPGATLCYVEVKNVVDRDETKGVCSRRKIIARIDSTEVCRYNARINALSVSHLWADSDDQNDVILDYLLTGDNRDSAARASARASARARARASAWASAWDSARDSAARASAWDSARDSAARASAWDSARASARASTWASAWDSVWDSTWDSARDSANARFNELIYECFEEILK